jgi:hypothetical protein
MFRPSIANPFTFDGRALVLLIANWGRASGARTAARELTAPGVRDLSSKRSVIPFTMEEHHAFILRRMAAHCDRAI